MVMGDEKRRMRFERVLLKGEEVEERRRERAKERKVTSGEKKEDVVWKRKRKRSLEMCDLMTAKD